MREENVRSKGSSSKRAKTARNETHAKTVKKRGRTLKEQNTHIRQRQMSLHRLIVNKRHDVRVRRDRFRRRVVWIGGPERKSIVSAHIDQSDAMITTGLRIIRIHIQPKVSNVRVRIACRWRVDRHKVIRLRIGNAVPTNRNRLARVVQLIRRGTEGGPSFHRRRRIMPRELDRAIRHCDHNECAAKQRAYRNFPHTCSRCLRCQRNNTEQSAGTSRLRFCHTFVKELCETISLSLSRICSEHTSPSHSSLLTALSPPPEPPSFILSFFLFLSLCDSLQSA